MPIPSVARSWHTNLRMPWSNPESPSRTDNHSERIRAYLKRRMEESKRGGYWFRLGRSQRALFSLALQLKVKFKSMVLARALVSILKELRELRELRGPGHCRLFVGAKVARAFSEAATKWGNEKAKAWRNNMRYITYLGTLFEASSK